jgi:8-hydroxy-5-deazaflavin:NADPH oxidoreductase
MSEPSGPIRTLGILGAGRVGATLARKAVEAGYRVLIAASGDPDAIAMMIEIIAPGAEPRLAADVIPEADAVVLAVPFAKHESLPLNRLGGKLVIDAVNYWAPSDGEIPEVTGSELGTSELIQAKLPPGTRLVKALNTVGYHELDLDARPKGAPDRKAIAVAGDDREAVRAVSHLIDDLGFDPVDAGGLANGRALEPGTSVFGTGLDAESTADYLRGNLSGAARACPVPQRGTEFELGPRLQR